MPFRGVAFVTGASQGIGEAIALRLADDGYDLAINDVSPRRESLDDLSNRIKDKGRKSLICTGDVSVEQEVKEMIDKVVQGLGGIDVMVANAGIFPGGVPIMEASVDDWDRALSVNARGTFLCYKFAAQKMIAQGRGGRIIGASSVLGKQGGANYGAYSASKFAIRGLTQSTAIELGKYNITVNAYAPGAIDTPMLHSSGDWEVIEAREEKIAPVGYIGKPNDIASVVSYLISKEAHFITGQTISVNGGGRFFD